jgi:aromatic ring hydroxylase
MESEILCDISGGIPATFPHEADFANPETGELLMKYTRRNPDMPVEDQAQFWRYMGDILCSAYGGIMNMGNFHGGGSPIMEQIAITSQYDIEDRSNWSAGAGMSPGKRKSKDLSYRANRGG